MWNQGSSHIYIAGHRGWPEKYPENTISSFIAAANVGVDMVEMDVRLTADRQLVVIHDATVDRTTNGKGLVKEKTLKEIKALDAGLFKGEEFKNTQIPTFEEALEALASYDDLLFNFEIKEYPKDGNDEAAYETTDKALALIEKYHMTSRCVINIFDATLLEYIHKKYKGRFKLHGYYPPEFLHLTPTDEDPYTYLYCACPFAKPPREEDYQWLWHKGVQPWAGTWVKTKERVLQAISYKTPLITCDNPGTILAIVKALGLHP